MKIALILGTRPEIIKMSPVIKECEKRNLEYVVLHTGQHYDYKLDKIFFKELGLSPESVNLNIGSGTHGQSTGKMLIGIEKALVQKNPDIALIQGDTNTVLAGALAAVKLHIKLGHVEAGLRSYDRKQPEEYNRIVADHVSDMLFVPTKKSKQTLLNEGIDKNRIFMTGNTIVDSIYQALKIAKIKSKILEELDLQKNNYFLVTMHREENVDDKNKLIGVMNGLKNISKEYDLPIIYPLHPRTRKKIKEFGLEKSVSEIKNLKLIEPVGFFDILMLEKNVKLVLTDSGGVVEEACILGVPSVSLRYKSDRPETIDIGASTLSGCEPERILKMTKLMVKRKNNWKNPFGDGRAGERIIDVINNLYRE